MVQLVWFKCLLGAEERVTGTMPCAGKSCLFDPASLGLDRTYER